jgi:amino-acid N-acetyltransferase
MVCIEPPPPSRAEEPAEKVSFREDNGGHEVTAGSTIRKALVSDVEEIVALVNSFAASQLMLPRGPQYVYENIRDFVVAVRTPETNSDGPAREDKILACGSLHILWGDLAEVRSLAIHPDVQGRGLGRRIVTYMTEDAKRIGIKKLFAFTVAEAFFRALGFELKSREAFPAKVWGECSRCPKYFKCDEVGMMLEL